MSLLLALLYPIAIQYERGGLWWCVLPITFVAFIVDVLANWGELALIYGKPKADEWTFSQRLKRLSYLEGWRGDLARWCVGYCNRWAPKHNHIV